MYIPVSLSSVTSKKFLSFMECPVQSSGNLTPWLIPVISAFWRQEEPNFKGSYIARLPKTNLCPMCWETLNKWEQKTLQRIALNFLTRVSTFDATGIILATG